MGQKRRPRRLVSFRPLKFVASYEGIHIYLNASGAGWRFVVHNFRYEFRYMSEEIASLSLARDAVERFCALRVLEAQKGLAWMSLGSGD